MVGITVFKRVPRPVFALALMALALVAGVTTTKHAEAAQPAYLVELTFETITFTHLDDCSFLELSGCALAEAFMTMSGKTQSGGSYDGLPVRNLGTFGTKGPSGCSTIGHPWTNKPGACLAQVDPFTGAHGPYAFKDTPLCYSDASSRCQSGYFVWSHAIHLRVQAGESILPTLLARDYDEVSGNDDICNVAQWHGPFSAAQLDTLNWTPPPMTSSNADGGCSVTIHLKTIKPLKVVEGEEGRVP